MVIPRDAAGPASRPAQSSNCGKRRNRFVFGLYRRHMKVISYLGMFDRLFGVPVTTRNWNTITAIASVLGNRRS